MKASEEQKARMRQYFQDNKDRYAHYCADYRDGLKAEVVAAYGGKCADCGESDSIVLSLDHKNDDAHIEKELYGLNARGGHKLYARLKKEGWPKERFQLLCFNCNAKKEHIRRRAGMLERRGTFVPADRKLVQARMGLKRHNSSGLKGVFWNSSKQRWQARIGIDYKQQHLGFFVDPVEAALAYRKAALELWGEEANVQTDKEIFAAAAALAKREEFAPATATAEDLGL